MVTHSHAMIIEKLTPFTNRHTQQHLSKKQAFRTREQHQNRCSSECVNSVRVNVYKMCLTNLHVQYVRVCVCVCVRTPHVWVYLAVPPRGPIIITCFSRAKNMQLTGGCRGAELHRRQLELQQQPAARIHYQHCEYWWEKSDNKETPGWHAECIDTRCRAEAQRGLETH